MTSPTPEQDPLQPLLRETEAELKEHLHEACEADSQDVTKESTDELRELEDTLLAAAVAVEQTISLRRHVQKREAAAVERERQAEAQRAQEVADRAQSVSVREFHDSSGRPWRAWSVTPGLRPGRDAKRYLGEFHEGWLCFEALDGSARRRLPRYPKEWVNLEEPALDNLLRTAVDAPERKSGKETAAAQPREAQAHSS